MQKKDESVEVSWWIDATESAKTAKCKKLHHPNLYLYTCSQIFITMEKKIRELSHCLSCLSYPCRACSAASFSAACCSVTTGGDRFYTCASMLFECSCPPTTNLGLSNILLITTNYYAEICFISILLWKFTDCSAASRLISNVCIFTRQSARLLVDSKGVGEH